MKYEYIVIITSSFCFLRYTKNYRYMKILIRGQVNANIKANWRNICHVLTVQYVIETIRHSFKIKTKKNIMNVCTNMLGYSEKKKNKRIRFLMWIFEHKMSLYYLLYFKRLRLNFYNRKPQQRSFVRNSHTLFRTFGFHFASKTPEVCLCIWIFV